MALGILVDGRNARNGYCTWPMILDTVESALAHLRAERGLPVCDPPSAWLAKERENLKDIEDLADELVRRTHAVRAEAYNPMPNV